MKIGHVVCSAQPNHFKTSYYITEDGTKLIGLTWKIDTRIEPHPITTEDYQKVSNPFVREVVDTGIKVA